MDDLHNPTVPSGPTTNGASSNGALHDKASLMELMDQKNQVEEELSALGGVLDSVSGIHVLGFTLAVSNIWILSFSVCRI